MKKMSEILFNNITAINAHVIKKIIDESAGRRAEMKSLYDRYKGCKDGVPILTRKYKIDNEEQQGKINNKLANDFFSEIVDMKVGFLCGVPISYTLDKEKYPEAEYKKNMEAIQYFNKINTIPDVDAESAKLATICGLSSRLFYYDEEANVKISLIKPWETCYIGDTIDAPLISLRIYETETINGDGKEIELYNVDVFDKTLIAHWERKEDEDLYKFIKESPHKMPFNPLFGVANNDELIGDAEKVLTLIDGYDRTFSDVDSELEQLRLAYLAAYGFDISPEVLKAARQTGAFSVPVDGRIEWLIKTLDDIIIEHHLDRLEKNIYRFSKTPNMNDISAASQIANATMKFKFKSFEDKCKTAELKFAKSLIQQYKLLSDIWKLQNKASVNYLDMEFIFTRNYPQNLLEEIKFLTDAKGIITDETAFGLVSFIKDPTKEAAALEEQKQASIDEFMNQQSNIDQQNIPQNKDNTPNMQGKST
jgi:SPP1 family phage portal protein